MQIAVIEPPGLIGAYDQFQGSADIAGPGSRRDRSGRHEWLLLAVLNYAPDPPRTFATAV